MESRVNQEEAQAIKVKYGFEFGFSMDCRGVRRERECGLMLFWKKSLNITISPYSSNHIGGTMVDECDNQNCSFNRWQLQNFWAASMGPSSCRQLRIGGYRFAPLKVCHLPCYGSDHAVIRLELEEDSNGKGRKRSHIFRFEEVWSRDPRCEDVVKWLSNNYRLRELFATSSSVNMQEQINPLKTPGLDGPPKLFFHKYWHFVGPNVRSVVLDMINNGKDSSRINDTHTSLILKCKNPTRTKDFHPIILCNVIMKLITKTIEDMIKCVLPGVIDEE
ncbi:unnamed protein product [Vicia faba]|uniref:Uncharacterized protein n=1 Tax=Vicia faba TaxID=3906 RepID=A0AAV0Z2E9_VICFA|nr:unnamed protein product [Vicia faba]